MVFLYEQKNHGRSHGLFKEELGSAKVPAVGGDDPLVPIKGLFLVAGPGAGAVVVPVHIDEAVPLAQLAGAEGHHIDAAPRGIQRTADAGLSARPL